MSLSGDVLKKIDPIEYFDRFLSEGLYPDGRDIGESRPIKIEIGIGEFFHFVVYCGSKGRG